MALLVLVASEKWPMRAFMVGKAVKREALARKKITGKR